MPIYGVSQSSGADRLLDLQAAEGGVLVHIHDTTDPDRGKIVVSRQAIDEVLGKPPGHLMTLDGTVENPAGPQQLDLQIKGGDVLLAEKTAAGDGWDIAVGLDDFIEAFEATA